MLQQQAKETLTPLEFTSTWSPPPSPSLPLHPTSRRLPEENNVMTPAAEAGPERRPGGTLTARWQSLSYNISNKSAVRSQTLLLSASVQILQQKLVYCSGVNVSQMRTVQTCRSKIITSATSWCRK